MKVGLEQKLYTGLGLLLVTLVAIMTVSERGTVRLISDSQWVVHTHEVKSALAGVLAAIADAEASSRGFVIGGDETFLIPYHAEEEQIAGKVLLVRTLTRDNPVQQARMDALEPLVRAKFEAMRGIIETRRKKGIAAASDIISAGQTRLLMEQIRTALAAMDREEGRLLELRRAQNNRMIETTSVTIRIALAGAILSGLFAGIAIGQDVRRRRRLQAQLDLFFDLSIDMFCIAGFDGYFKKLNSAWQRTLGYSDLELTSSSFMDFVHPEDRESTARESATLTQGKETLAFENRYRMKDGSYRWLLWNSVGVPEQQLIYASARDITEHKKFEVESAALTDKLQLAARKSEQEAEELRHLGEMNDLLQTAEAASDAYSIAEDYCIRFFHSLYGAVFRMSASKNLVEPVRAWGEAPASDIFAPQDCLALRRGRPYVGGPESPIQCKHVENTESSYLCVPLQALSETIGILHLRQGTSAFPISSGTQRLAAIVGGQLALTLAGMGLKETLRAQSVRDHLTGLFNRRYLEETMEREIRRAGRGDGTVAAFMLDLDHFKRINDTFGHDAGDAVLRNVAGLLRSRVRFEDIVCRFGGEEFAIVLPDASLEKAQEVANRICAGVRELRIKHDDRDLDSISISIGIAVFPMHGGNTELLFKAADAALYLAKSTGRDQAVAAA